MSELKEKLIQQKQCTRPDRDSPTLKCGYPLPCPWHDSNPGEFRYYVRWMKDKFPFKQR